MKHNNNSFNVKLDEIFESIIDSKTDNYSLFEGKPGIILFLGCYYLTFNSKRALYKIHELLFDVVNYYSQKNTFKSFANGICGYVWLLRWLNNQDLISVNKDTYFLEIESFLLQYMNQEIEKGNYDYMHGALGPFLYFSSISRNDICHAMVEKIYEIGIKHSKSNGRRWFYYKDEKTIDYSVSFGLSHGITSILALVNYVYTKGINKGKCITLMNEISHYLLFHKQKVSRWGSFFPYSFDEDLHNNHYSRLAWCYGDLGIGYTLLVSGKLLNDIGITKQANKILLHSSFRRDCDANLVYDASFCHGAAGNAYLFNKLFLLTKKVAYKNAANYWLNTSLDFSCYDNSFAGFKTCRSKIENDYYESYGILEGISGIGLVLLSTISNIPATWDEVFLI